MAGERISGSHLLGPCGVWLLLKANCLERCLLAADTVASSSKFRPKLRADKKQQNTYIK